MRTMLAAAFVLLAASALTPPPAPASAGEVTGCDCQNACPLAQEANRHRATGAEAVLVSKVVRADFVRAVVKNLSTP